jgi:hypothetical protein
VMNLVQPFAPDAVHIERIEPSIEDSFMDLMRQ